MFSYQSIFYVSLTFNFLFHCLAALSTRITANVVAAWRSGGFHCTSCGVQTFNSALPFLRASCRHYAKP
jgi:hypothetical protein